MSQDGVLCRVPAHLVRAGNNDRKVFDPAKLRELADSIAEHGLAQPPTVRKTLVLPCGHHVCPTTESERELWSILYDHQSRLFATQPDYLMEKGASTSLKTATALDSISLSPKRTVVSSFSDGFNSPGVSEESIASSRSSTRKSQQSTSGTGPSTPPGRSSSSWTLSCPTCVSSLTLHRQPLPSFANESSVADDSFGRQGKNNTFVKTGNKPTTRSAWSLPVPQGQSVTSESRSDLASPKEDLSEVAVSGVGLASGINERWTISWGTGEKRIVPLLPHSGEHGKQLVESESHWDFSSPEAGFEIIAGERRFRAMTAVLNWEVVPVIVREVNDAVASGIMLVENTSRSDLNPIEEGNAYASRMQLHGWSVTEVAAKAGVSPDRVRSRLALINLPAQMQTLVAGQQMPLQHAEVLGQQESAIQGQAIRVWSAKPNMTLSELREVINQLVSASAQPMMFMVADQLESKVRENPKPIIGQDAEIPIVEDDTVPDFEVGRRETVGEACHRYMTTLEASGLTSEAAAVGKLYRALVRARKTFAAGNVLERPS